MFWSDKWNRDSRLDALAGRYTQSEAEVVDALLSELGYLTERQEDVHALATELIAFTRQEETAKKRHCLAGSAL